MGRWGGLRLADPRGRLDRPSLPPRLKKEVFDAETYAIYQALRTLDPRRECGHQYTVFVDSTAAIVGVRTDVTGPGQRFAVVAMEVCFWVLERDNDVTIRWVIARHGVTGNETADEYAKVAAEGSTPRNDVPDEFWWETSFAHMTRTATAARSRATAEGIGGRAARLKERWAGRARPRLFVPFPFFFLFATFLGGFGEKEMGSPTMTGFVGVCVVFYF